MQDFGAAFGDAFRLVSGLDADLVGIVALSLQVTLSALALACLIGMPIGAALAIWRFPGRRTVEIVVAALMGLPPVVVGLTVYMLLSRAGPFGVLDLLYTPTAMIIAQTILITPIVMTLSRQACASLYAEYGELLHSMRASRHAILGTILWEARPALMTAALAGLGRALAEVGAVMIVGGNIDRVTRVMTTAIATETSRGELALALGLGLVLLCLSITITAGLMLLERRSAVAVDA